MKKSTKFILISIGTLVVGISAYLTFRPRRFEDNGLSPDTMAEVNALTELDNTTGENKIIVGDTIYPSGSYVNVRYSALVNNGILNNIMMEVESPNAVGIVDDIVYGDNNTWYRVQLNQDLTNNVFGFVRADVVTKII